ncbi:MAG TPA: MotA/TolQ/ExbB proton channel family protein [Phycisphaerales bacterium]|nr:MotA/TolQ/ExbB proton channel family protein [Phycisphaerales bacterium]HMP35890.1 MotA/TolQ/ExbB proton channel family protein [Phycisphaerales bacterium]
MTPTDAGRSSEASLAARPPGSAFLAEPQHRLRYAAIDPEARLGLPSGLFTTPHAVTTLIVAAVAIAILYGVAWLFRESTVGAVVWHQLTGFGRIPIPMAFLSLWSLSILFFKWRKIAAQRRALEYRFMPGDSAFVLSTETAGRVIAAIEEEVDRPDRFIQLARVLIALKGVRNFGRIGDVDELLESQAAHDEAAMESGYTVLRGFIWAIPVLGFIGTVIGLTAAISSFGTILDDGGGANVEQLTRQLGGVVRGLDTAFVTTGQALVAALAIHLLQTFARRADESLLDDIRRRCAVEVVGRVRVARTAGE